MPRRVDWSGVSTRVCTKCGLTKLLSEFKQRYNRIGDPAPDSVCKVCCSRKDARLYRRKAAYNLACYGYVAGPPDKRTEQNRRMRERNMRLKIEVIKEYGGTCECCGETGLAALTIDHINGNGASERRLFGLGTRFYRYLRKAGYPRNGYRVLCCNCNFALGWFGYCPHQVGSQYELAAMVSLDRGTRYRHRVRIRTFYAYGGECVLCGEDRPEFLNIHHIIGGGNAERRELGIATDGIAFYRYLERLGYPRDAYMLTCSNCNRKELYNTKN